jgi:hypothetical protein
VDWATTVPRRHPDGSAQHPRQAAAAGWCFVTGFGFGFLRGFWNPSFGFESFSVRVDVDVHSVMMHFLSAEQGVADGVGGGQRRRREELNC